MSDDELRALVLAQLGAVEPRVLRRSRRPRGHRVRVGRQGEHDHMKTVWVQLGHE